MCSYVTHSYNKKEEDRIWSNAQSAEKEVVCSQAGGLGASIAEAGTVISASGDCTEDSSWDLGIALDAAEKSMANIGGAIFERKYED